MEAILRRAGFWRRAGAAILDTLVVLLPLQLLVAVAFLVTNGAVQGGFGVALTTCAPVALTAEQTRALQPPAPANANAAVRCDTGFLGLTMARTLSVLHVESKQTPNGGQIQTTVGTGYSLNAAGEVVAATDMGLPALGLLAFAIVAQWALRGRTLGGWLLRLRVAARRAPEAAGLGWGRAAARFLLAVLTQVGLALPGFAVVLYLLNRGPEVLLASFWGWPAALLIGGMLAQIVVVLWMILDIIRRRDPLYDRWAGTMVLVD